MIINEQKTPKHASEIINALMEEYADGVIKNFEFSPMMNMNTGETIGFGIIMQVATKYDYPESLLDQWRKRFGADEYSIHVNRNQLWITFKVRDFVPTEKHIAKMAHAIGLDNKQPKDGAYEAYRNGSYYDEPVKEWDELELSGYATSRRSEHDYRYYVRPKGMQLLADHYGLMIRCTDEYEPKRKED